MTNEVPIFFWI